MGSVGGNGKTELPRATINMEARADVAAWAYALHVTEQDLTDAVAKVGNHARAVIPYILKRAERPARPDGMTSEARRQASRRRREGAVDPRSAPR